MANQPTPVTRTTRREATIVLRFVETVREVYADPAPSSSRSVFAERGPGLAKVSNVVELAARRAAGTR